MASFNLADLVAFGIDVHIFKNVGRIAIGSLSGNVSVHVIPLVLHLLPRLVVICQLGNVCPLRVG